MMTNRSYSYTRLLNADDISNGRDQRSNECEAKSTDTKLRRLPIGQRKERWPGSASHIPSPSSADFIEHVVKPNDTLQHIALTYNCRVFDINVANGLLREVDLYGKRTLRIPVKRHSSLTQQTPAVLADSNQAHVKPVLPDPLARENSREFLKQKDQDLERLKEKARVYEINESLLVVETTPATLSLARPKRTSRIPIADCRGDDCGLSWPHILGLALLVLLACPLLYFLYLELNLHKNVPSNVTTANSSSATTTDALL